MTSGGDPRFRRSRDVIVTAARELLIQHGPTAVTHQRIAEHAGIGRATVYRHWPRTDQLLAEAMTTVTMPFFAEPSSPYRAWIIREVMVVARQLDYDDVLAVTATLISSAVWDEAMDQRRAGFARVLATRVARGLELAQQHGELELTVAPLDAVALLLGPIVYRATLEHQPSSSELIEQSVDALGKWRPR